MSAQAPRSLAEGHGHHGTSPRLSSLVQRPHLSLPHLCPVLEHPHLAGVAGAGIRLTLRPFLPCPGAARPGPSPAPSPAPACCPSCLSRSLPGRLLRHRLLLQDLPQHQAEATVLPPATGRHCWTQNSRKGVSTENTRIVFKKRFTWKHVQLSHLTWLLLGRDTFPSRAPSAPAPAPAHTPSRRLIHRNKVQGQDRQGF